MAFDRRVEEIIRNAIERGEFTNLRGKGKPVDLTAYFQAPEEVRVVQALLKNAGIAPREVELLREIWELRQREAAAQDAGSRQRLRRQVARRQLELDLRLEQTRRRMKAH